jgi:hypothetical protein
VVARKFSREYLFRHLTALLLVFLACTFFEDEG